MTYIILLFLILVTNFGFSYVKKSDFPLIIAHSLLSILLTVVYFSLDLWAEAESLGTQVVIITPLYYGAIFVLCNEYRKEFKEFSRTDSAFSSSACINAMWQITVYFALMYTLLEIGRPSSFESVNTEDYFSRAVDFLYFSITTFSTVGFGDITPQTEWAKLMVSSEILIAFCMLVIAVNFFRGGKEEVKKEEEEQKMNFMDNLKITNQQLKIMAKDKEVTEVSVNAFTDLISSLMGDPVSAAKLIYTLTQTPAFLREQFFWSKFELFLQGIALDDKQVELLRKRFETEGDTEKNTERLISCIDKLESKSKVQYLVNATQFLLSCEIDIPLYFRICSIISSGLEEDFLFLGENIGKDDLPYNISTQGLYTMGMMYISIIDAGGVDGSGGGNRYSFTPLAEEFCRYAMKIEVARIFAPSTDNGVRAATSKEIQALFSDEVDD